MKLYILRHAIAVERGTDPGLKDSDRMLTREGIRKLKLVIKAINCLGISFDLILSSPYLRALQTAQLTAKGLGAKKQLEITDNLKPDSSFRALIEELHKRKCSSVVIVGHEPHLSGFISFLLTGKAELSIDLKKSGLCLLCVETVRYGRCATAKEGLAAIRYLRCSPRQPRWKLESPISRNREMRANSRPFAVKRIPLPRRSSSLVRKNSSSSLIWRLYWLCLIGSLPAACAMLPVAPTSTSTRRRSSDKPFSEKSRANMTEQYSIQR
jgi:phosphohistidine phosphatase